MDKISQNILSFILQNSTSISCKKVLYGMIFIIALTIYIMQISKLSLPVWINNHVNDLLFLPLTLGAITYIVSWLKKDIFYELSLGFVILSASFYSFYFEYYLPQFNSRYTGDVIDVILYFSGGFAFFIMNKASLTKPFFTFETAIHKADKL